MQPSINVHISEHGMSFFFFIHNKGQMYFPKRDEAYGSSYIFKRMPKREGTMYSQKYRLERTHWKTLDTENQRCDEVNDNKNTTQCITTYIEKTVGCSVGMFGTDPHMKR